MVERAIATKLALRAMNQSDHIGSLDDRKRIQKLIYLAQAKGVSLGYGFSWYLRGPYSSTLAKDYYNTPAIDLNSTDAPTIRADLLPRLQQVGEIPTDNRRPQGLQEADWLEIVASVHYLERVAKLDEVSATDKLRREKPHLVEHVEVARDVVNQYFPKTQAN
ncbi:hypothetical protein [Devosia sp.]|uniref:hypothetical protein n=1 Tax=Devosia sp. TaxID=1871048 RepID=UPI0027323F84|nr:hypothetical protein [Devosia sp.]MDP2781586.1 hypothetical protein [Devosia sp.]